METRCFPERYQFDGAGEGIRTPDLLITNQLLYRPELRQHKTQILARPVPCVQVIGRTDNGWAFARSDKPLFYMLFATLPNRFK